MFIFSNPAVSTVNTLVDTRYSESQTQVHQQLKHLT
uniref:Uncharacterized protein n=1 Tax=Anguilla anguilla TaxID=7936 RepID=A0A0E9S3C2_ANGAN